MTIAKTDILVYAHWKGMDIPKWIGTLSAQQAEGRKAFGFRYENEWLASHEQRLLDPDLGLYSGSQYPSGKENFGMIMDSMPDTWGRTLMRRREVIRAKEENRAIRVLYDIDFLLGVNDETRMGALRFKLSEDGDFIHHDKVMTAPPWTSLRELQHAVKFIEEDHNTEEVKKWLDILLGPGSSLGGARPKANVFDETGNLWIAKFPSANDVIDKAAWEFLAYQLAIDCGIEMSSCRIEIIAGRQNTFFTKRFDREQNTRIHFASAMTMTRNDENTTRDQRASYLDIAEFIQFNGSQNKKDLNQLWKRIVFHIAISNTDDHLRNHGFLLTDKGWKLSPAYDLNPSIDKDGLTLNINAAQNDLDFDLAISVGEYFKMHLNEMKSITDETRRTVSGWSKYAREIGISRAEQDTMSGAFRF
ncbi:MAG: HipA domain-containing protein [Bacteroidota bacterium]|nr:HipA domain-containing protein [Bacteroidota bacterium]